MTLASLIQLPSLRRLIWAGVGMLALVAAVVGPARDVEAPVQAPASVMAEAELECPQPEAASPGPLCAERWTARAPRPVESLPAADPAPESPPPSPPLRPPRA